MGEHSMLAVFTIFLIYALEYAQGYCRYYRNIYGAITSQCTNNYFYTYYFVYTWWFWAIWVVIFIIICSVSGVCCYRRRHPGTILTNLAPTSATVITTVGQPGPLPPQGYDNLAMKPGSYPQPYYPAGPYPAGAYPAGPYPPGQTYPVAGPPAYSG